MTTHRAEIEADLERGPEELAAADPFWPAQLAVLAGLVWASPFRRRSEVKPWRRITALFLTGFVAAVNTVSLGLLIHFVVKGGRTGGYELVLSGAEIWVTAVLIYAVAYWELDGGGATERGLGRR